MGARRWMSSSALPTPCPCLPSHDPITACRVFHWRVTGKAAGRIGTECLLQAAVLLSEHEVDSTVRRWSAECRVYLFPTTHSEGGKRQEECIFVFSLPEDPDWVYAVQRDGKSITQLDRHAQILLEDLGVKLRTTAVFEGSSLEAGSGVSLYVGRVVTTQQGGLRGFFCELEDRASSLEGSQEKLEDYLSRLTEQCEQQEGCSLAPVTPGPLYSSLGDAFSLRHLALLRAALLKEILYPASVGTAA